MKKNYCEFCGQELEHGRCDCKGLDNLIKKGVNIYNRQKKKCLYCKSTMYVDSNFCPNCGMPNDNINVFDEKLQKELMGEEKINLSHINEEEIKKRKSIIERQLNQALKIKILLLIIIVLLSLILIFKYIIPFAKDMMFNMRFSREVAMHDMEDEDDESIIEPSESGDNKNETKTENRYKSEWIRKDGNFYAFDENGDPIVDEWVEEKDEKTGVISKYYFDIEGKLVTNSWVNNEYYVASDGRMLTNTYTPDGVRVDKDGRAVLETSATIPPTTTREKKTEATVLVYDSPLDDGSVIGVEDSNVINNQASSAASNAGTIKGNIDKSADLYISSLKSYTTTTEKNGNTVNLKYYYPVVKGKDATEVKELNDLYKKYFETEFKSLLSNYIDDYQEDVASLTLNTVEQMTINKNRYWIKLTGKLIKANGKSVTIRYRVRYHRDTQVIVGEKIS